MCMQRRASPSGSPPWASSCSPSPWGRSRAWDPQTTVDDAGSPPSFGNDAPGGAAGCRDGLVALPCSWHSCGMARIRVSTTVDESLLESARSLRSELNDAALLDEALNALVGQYRSAEIDAGYAVYDERPLDEADEWGDLASFREAAGSS